VLDVPIALISLVDEGRQWFKARVGLESRETPRELAFCAHAIHGMDVYVVHDATQNPLFKDNALVTGAPDIRFYAGAPLRSHDGFNLGTVCAIDRIPREPTTAQLALLHDLAALTSDLLELRTAGRTALDEVAERKRIDAYKSAFISTVNHELRTPLTSIIGAIELINTGVAGEISQEVDQLIGIADRNAAVLLRLINDLLDSAKLADGNLKFELTVTDIHQVVRESVENIENYCRDHNVTVIYQGQPVNPVRADRLRIAQVMNNLLSNAVKFSPPKSTVTVTLVERNGAAEVSVIDMAGASPRQSVRASSRSSSKRNRQGYRPDPAPASASASRRLSSSIMAGRLDLKRNGAWARGSSSACRRSPFKRSAIRYAARACLPQARLP
jgi:signal transduction histidine kinase